MHAHDTLHTRLGARCLLILFLNAIIPMRSAFGMQVSLCMNVIIAPWLSHTFVSIGHGSKTKARCRKLQASGAGKTLSSERRHEQRMVVVACD